MRDTKSIFPKPNIISLDAFGTIYIPKESIPVQYLKIASAMGIEKSAESIKHEFPLIRKELLEEYPNYGKYSLQSVDEWWLRLIMRLFDIKDSAKSLELCQTLIKHFSSSDGYRLFDDIIPTLYKLKQHEIQIIISTNSDPRVYDVLESLGVMQFVDKAGVYLSYNLDVEKPTKLFFDSILQDVLQDNHKADYLSGVWHVGDSHDMDYLGAIRAGWNGVFIDRNATSQYFQHYISNPEIESPSCISLHIQIPVSDMPMHVIADNRIVISDLRQLLSLFDLE